MKKLFIVLCLVSCNQIDGINDLKISKSTTSKSTTSNSSSSSSSSSSSTYGSATMNIHCNDIIKTTDYNDNYFKAVVIDQDWFITNSGIIYSNLISCAYNKSILCLSNNNANSTCKNNNIALYDLISNNNCHDLIINNAVENYINEAEITDCKINIICEDEVNNCRNDL